MTQHETLVPAEQLVKTNRAHFPNESAAYRRPATRCWSKRSSFGASWNRSQRQRRALPPGGEVTRGLPLRRRERSCRLLPTCSPARIR